MTGIFGGTLSWDEAKRLKHIDVNSIRKTWYQIIIGRNNGAMDSEPN